VDELVEAKRFKTRSEAVEALLNQKRREERGRRAR